jgi:predicted Fe-Mo cluster-binding NifX family protein
MKIAVSSEGPNLDSQVDPRFGRCPYFVIVDTDTMEFEAIQNTYSMAAGGAGIQTAQMIANRGVEVVLTGSCGPNAYQTLSAAGVQVVVGVAGTVKEAIERFKAGQLPFADQPNVPMHFGIGAGIGYGFGPGRGCGMGRGMGRGRGGRMGRGFGMMQARMTPPGFPPQVPSQQPMLTPEQEIQMLKSQAEMLKQQLEQITKRLNELEKKQK